MIWVKIASGRFYAGASGTERLHNLMLQDWGLQVKDLLAAAVVTGRSASGVGIRLRYDEGATDDLAALTTGATNNVIHSGGQPVTVPTSLPGTVKGSSAALLLPYLRFQLGVTGTTAEDWVELEVYVGGKPF